MMDPTIRPLGHLVGFTLNFKHNLLTGHLGVQLLERVQLVVDGVGVLRVQVHLADLGTTDQVSDSLTDDFGGEDQVFEDGVVDGGQGSRPGSLLLLSRLSGGLGQDLSFTQEHDVSVGELLFQFTGQSSLDLLVSGERGRGDEHHQHLLTTGDVDFLDVLELQGTEFGLEVALLFQVNEGLGNLGFQFSGLFVQDLLSDRHDVAFGCGSSLVLRNFHTRRASCDQVRNPKARDDIAPTTHRRTFKARTNQVIRHDRLK